MKKITLFTIILFSIATINPFTSNAQNSTHKWAIGVNWQWQDFNTIHLQIPKQLKYAKWQGYKFPSALSISRYLNPSFNLFGQFGVSELELDRMSSIGQPLSDTKFWTGDLNVAYKFANGYLLKENCWFDPYIYLGVGASDIKDQGATKTTYLKQVTGLGFNFWLTPAIGLNFQGAFDYLITPKLNGEKRDDYMHYTAGLKFRFGGKDTDGDGIPDKKDLCPDAAGLAQLGGCPDKDGDGIADKDDDCPDVAGKAEFKGCPDTDGDGIPDKDDACPTVAGVKELKGCPDKDGDGIADKDDRCPDVFGKKELKGCPDKDGDGIADIDDECPDLKGPASLKGCPDTDGDGIPDKDDKCPTVAGVAANHGCPPEPEKPAFTLYKVVYFNTAQNVVISKYTKDLNEVASIMKDQKEVSVNIEGYADSQGDDAYNMRLSEKRADYVINYLVKKGIEKTRLTKAFYGESNPVGDNNTAEGRAQNRRVEIKSK